MRTRNEIVARAPLESCLRAAVEVERWPEILPHYREVRFVRKDGRGRGRVRMEAIRAFGPLPYPTWWESEMVTDFDAARIRYRHVDGVTEGMDVLWDLERMDAAAGGDPGARRAGEETPGAGGAARESPAAAAPAERRAGEPAELTRIVVLHDWDGPGWPAIGGFAARRIIGPHFVKVIADRTLAGIRAEAEAEAEAAARADGDARRS